jgi:alpha-tubulin suppressor-like RCC1 family protein
MCFLAEVLVLRSLSLQIPSRIHHEPTLIDTCIEGNVEWTQIACSGSHFAALTTDGEVYTWGIGRCGQLLEHGAKILPRNVPTKVSLYGLVVTKISCSGLHMAVITNKGKILTW